MFEDKSSQLCRLCLKSGDCPVDIYVPKCSNGFLVWEVIEELTEMKIYLSDGLPPTICEDCMKKLTDFKYFKRMCIDSRMEFLSRRMNNGLVVPMTDDESGPLREDLCGQGDVHTRDTWNNLEAEGIESEVTSVNCTDEPNAPVDGDRGRVGNLEETLISEKGPNRFAGTGHQRSVGIQCGAFGDLPVATHSPFKQRRLRSNSRNENDGVAVDVRVESEGRRQIEKRILYTCHVWSKEFSRKGSLKAHIKIVHLKEQKFPCGICGKAFGEKGALQTHIRYHNGVKPYMCGHCEKGFTESGNLRRHIQAVHEMEKPHTCGECGKAFSLKQNLVQHMLVHTGERPHTCDICSRSFSLKQVLKMHMLIHTGEKPHICYVCSKTFRHNSSLKHHMATHARKVSHQ